MADKHLESERILEEDERNYRPLAAAVVTQAITDLTHPDILIRLDAILWLAHDLPAFTEALGMDSESGFQFLRTGQARRAVENATRELELTRRKDFAKEQRQRRRSASAV